MLYRQDRWKCGFNKEKINMSKSQVDFFKKKNEWSEIKDRLLEGYLPQYFQKLLTTHRQIFYVDCFAGKGKFDYRT